MGMSRKARMVDQCVKARVVHQLWLMKPELGGGFNSFHIFHPGEMPGKWSNLTNILFSKWVTWNHHDRANNGQIIQQLNNYIVQDWPLNGESSLTWWKTCWQEGKPLSSLPAPPPTDPALDVWMPREGACGAVEIMKNSSTLNGCHSSQQSTDMIK